MYLLLLGLALLALKLLDINPVAGWAWWVVLAPFGLATLWWWWADATGYTRRKAMEREEQRKRDRINKQRDQLGLKRRRR